MSLSKHRYWCQALGFFVHDYRNTASQEQYDFFYEWYTNLCLYWWKRFEDRPTRKAKGRRS